MWFGQPSSYPSEHRPQHGWQGDCDFCRHRISGQKAATTPRPVPARSPNTGGGWCPYCNIQLRAYQGILDELKNLGASLVAVSPETPDNSLDTRQREKLEFHVLSDNENVVAKQFGLVFPVSAEVHLLFEGWDINLETHNGIDSGEIPVPATYIIDEKGTIVFGKPDVDYRTRVEPMEILKALSSL